MKKVISVILATILLIATLSAALTAYAKDDSLKIAVASDLHLNLPSEELEGNIDDEIYWYANRRAAMEDESGFIIDEFLKQCAEDNSIEYVLISGDLVDNGRVIIEEHYAVAEKLRKFEEETGKDVFVINGNHDFGIGGEYTGIEDFVEIYADFGYDKAIEKVEGTCSYTANLGSKYRLIALDSCDYTKSTKDGLTADRVSWAVKQAENAYADGRYPILMMHHNLLDHMPLQSIFSADFIVRNHLTTADKFADAGIKVVFTGHEHCSDGAVHISPKGNKIYDFATTSLTMYPLEYRVFNFAENEITYEAKAIDSIDTDALTQKVRGYSEKQISLMNEGLNAYAKGFLKKGIEYRLSLSLSMEKIGIAEGEAFYDLVNTAVTGLTDLLEMNLYGEGGVQEYAKEFNIDIPNSNYKNGWDLATDLVAAHYEGEEKFDIQGTEVTILLKMVDLILLSDLSNVNDTVFFGAANKLLEKLGTGGIVTELTKLGAKAFGPVTAGEYFLLAVASPILHSFANDDDGVNDNHGILEGYGAENAQLDNIMENAKNIFEKLSLYFKFFVRYILKIFKIA